MKDVELRAQLVRLGMPATTADNMTRQLRDVIHPVAATAAAKMRDHQNALEQYAAYGDAGLSGYEVDELSGLFKSIKKGVKKVGKVVKKVALPVAAAVAAPFTGGASLAVLATTGAVAAGTTLINARSQKKANKKLTAALSSAPKTPPASIMNDPSVPQRQTGNLSERMGKYRHVKVPKPLAEAGTQVAAQALQQGYPADAAALISAMMANQGASMSSPAALDVVRQVAAEGVEQTSAGPSALPKWALPVGLGAGLLLLFVMRKRA
jgi:hypothetical protein